MKATELIENQHRLVEKLFDQFESADDDEKPHVFDEILLNLVGHDAIEREIFYPACERKLGKDEEEDVLGESLIEHGVVEFCLFRADKNRRSEEFDKYVTVLKETVMHHVKEEEDELLPKVESEFEEEELEELGEEMQSRFDKAMKSDPKRPLRDNLQQVLAGRAKTSKKPPASRTRKTGSKNARSSRTTRSAARSGTRRSTKRAGARARASRKSR